MAPTTVLLPGRHDESLDPGRRLRVLSVAGGRPVRERVGPTLGVAGDPLVRGLAGDAGAGGELGDGVEAVRVEGDDAGSLEHGVGDGPGHGVVGKPCRVNEDVTPVPGLKCHPSDRSVQGDSFPDPLLRGSSC